MIRMTGPTPAANSIAGAPGVRTAGPRAVGPHSTDEEGRDDRADFARRAHFCYAPAYDIEADVQQIRIVTERLSGHVPTALIALGLDDARSICDKLNRRPGLDREAWTVMAAASMQAEDDGPDGGAWH